MIRAIPTNYRGYLFRSRLEARWAVFFDACRVPWLYEPQGYDLGVAWYLPDFCLAMPDGSRLFVEVKGQMTYKDLMKLNRFIMGGGTTIVLNNVPAGRDWPEIAAEIERKPDCFFSFAGINRKQVKAYPAINLCGEFELFQDKDSCDIDAERTAWAYGKARQAVFEHGENPWRRRGLGPWRRRTT